VTAPYVVPSLNELHPKSRVVLNCSPNLGDRLLLRLNIYGKPIANKYCEDEKNFEKRVKRLEIVETEAVEIYYSESIKVFGTITGVCKYVKGFSLHLVDRYLDCPPLGKMGLCSHKGWIDLVRFAGQSLCASERSARGSFVRFCQNGFYRPVL